MIFLSDLDGTLIDKEGTMKNEDVQAIQAWTKENIFGFVTGRDEAYCENLMKKYQLQCDYLITNNGANAYYKNKCLYSSLIDLSEAISICETIIYKGKGNLFYTDEEGNRYFPIAHDGMNALIEFERNQPGLGHFSRMDILEYLSTRKTGCAKLSIQIDEDIDAWLHTYRTLFDGVEVMKTSHDFIEITNKGTNKLNAFKSFGISECAFIGDGENDLALLEYLNHTYVMKHAPKSILHTGTIVDSVAQAIQIEGENEYV